MTAKKQTKAQRVDSWWVGRGRYIVAIIGLMLAAGVAIYNTTSNVSQDTKLGTLFAASPCLHAKDSVQAAALCQASRDNFARTVTPQQACEIIQHVPRFADLNCEALPDIPVAVKGVDAGSGNNSPSGQTGPAGNGGAPGGSGGTGDSGGSGGQGTTTPTPSPSPKKPPIVDVHTDPLPIVGAPKVCDGNLNVLGVNC